MTATEQSVVSVLDETIEALSSLDHERLMSLEERVVQLARSGALTGGSLARIVDRQYVLARVLDKTQRNLVVLNRLHGANRGNAWER